VRRGNEKEDKMVNLIVGCVISFILGAASAYIFINVTGRMK
jgi:hypothetical protein